MTALFAAQGRHGALGRRRAAETPLRASQPAAAAHLPGRQPLGQVGGSALALQCNCARPSEHIPDLLATWSPCLRSSVDGNEQGLPAAIGQMLACANLRHALLPAAGCRRWDR